MRRLFNSRPFIWILLALPALPLVSEAFVRDRYYAEVMYESGIWSVQLTVLALAISPLMRMTGGAKAIRWLLARRRPIGVAAFGYAALHAAIYIREISDFELIVLDILEPDLLVGWLGVLALFVLALTSNNFTQNLLAKRWKQLQRGAYLAIALALIHWLLIDQFLSELIFWTAIFAALQLVRIAIVRLNSK